MITRSSVSITEAGIYSGLIADYVEGHPRLRHFYKFDPHPASFQAAIDERNSFQFYRESLGEVMHEQHREFYNVYPELEKQVNSLYSSETYTITTGHQLCIATGPLFFLYKIASAINLCRRLKVLHPHLNFVPVYWMASEDHDVEEIRSIHIYGKTLTWDTSQQGATGRMRTDGIPQLLDELESLCGTEPFGADLIRILRNSYQQGILLSDATRRLVLSLFGKEGLLVIDADDDRLKRIFLPVMRQELALSPSFEIVQRSSDELARHYKVQVTPRPINLFYLDDQLRERIVREEDGTFRVLNTDLVFSRDVFIDILEKHPSRFSPNVVLRPVYQEMILPNLATLGGPGEIAYWLQLKNLFDYFNVPYPVLLPRAHALLLGSKVLDKAGKAGIDLKDLFKPVEELSRTYIQSQDDLSPALNAARKEFEIAFARLGEAFSSVDATLNASVQAELQKNLNGLDNLGKKGMAALKRKHEQQISRFRSVNEVVMPGGEPQERVLNFAPFYSQSGPAFISSVLEFSEVPSDHFNILLF
jgi:bacillithiol biosynthesis cysteine-adding enzyme BshC